MSLFTVNEAAFVFDSNPKAVPTKVTAVAAVRFVPVMTMLVPPVVGPDAGVKLVIVGAALVRYVKGVALPATPPAVLTTIVTGPAA